MGEAERTKLLEMLYADLRGLLVGGVGNAWQWVRSRARRAGATKHESLAALQREILGGHVQPDSVVTFPARPVAFGVFHRAPYMMPVIGTHTSQRLGPPIVSDNFALAMLGQIGTHWAPVGLYPSPAADLIQGTLFEPDARACGTVSLMGLGPVIQSLPFIANRRLQHRLDHTSTIVGTVRELTHEDLGPLGILAADYEALRKAGALWLLDMTGDEADAAPLPDDPATQELWGALYACGHFEFEKAPDRAKVIEALVGAFGASGIATTQMHDHVRGDTLIAGHGVRLTLGGGRTGPIFSLHQDVELLKGYGDAHRRFQALLSASLSAAAESFAASGTILANPDDVDFSYVDTTSAYSVLRSAAAKGIGEPVALAIRDWHRRRSTRSLPEESVALLPPTKE